MTVPLEVISRAARAPAHPTPLLFIHGAYTGAWCWEDHYLDWFADRGWASHALSFRGHGASPGRPHLDTLSIEDYVADLHTVIRSLPAPPVLIGHSMGGFVVQKYLEQASAPAVVLLCAVPPQGLSGPMMNLLMHQPGVLWDLNRLLGGGHPQVSSLREALFHQPVHFETLRACYLRMQPESLRAIWDMSGFALPQPARMQRPPMLVLGAAEDRLIPPSYVEQTAATYGALPEILPGIGHGVMLESGWEPPAQRIANWLEGLEL